MTGDIFDRTREKVGVLSTWGVETREAAQHPLGHPPQRVKQSQMSLVLLLRNPYIKNQRDGEKYLFSQSSCHGADTDNTPFGH